MGLRMNLFVYFKTFILCSVFVLSSCENSEFKVFGSAEQQSHLGKNQNLIFGTTVTTSAGWKVKASYPNFFETKEIHSWNIKGE
jgi:hypothetical protein